MSALVGKLAPIVQQSGRVPIHRLALARVPGDEFVEGKTRIWLVFFGTAQWRVCLAGDRLSVRETTVWGKKKKGGGQLQRRHAAQYRTRRDDAETAVIDAQKRYPATMACARQTCPGIVIIGKNTETQPIFFFCFFLARVGGIAFEGRHAVPRAIGMAGQITVGANDGSSVGIEGAAGRPMFSHPAACTVTGDGPLADMLIAGQRMGRPEWR